MQHYGTFIIISWQLVDGKTAIKSATLEEAFLTYLQTKGIQK